MHMGSDPINDEGTNSEFEAVIEKYKKRYGFYPERVLADKIYRSRDNRKFCKEHGIRISGPPPWKTWFPIQRRIKTGAERNRRKECRGRKIWKRQKENWIRIDHGEVKRNHRSHDSNGYFCIKHGVPHETMCLFVLRNYTILHNNHSKRNKEGM